jgi:UDP-N-acetylmuramate-alanine ligase
MNPGFLVGGVAENFGKSFRLTESNYFVIEADEYDTAYFDKVPKMWHYRPDTAIVTNIEFDHADIYRDVEAYKWAFSRFINLIPRNRRLIAGWDSPIVRELAPKSFAPVESFSYGTNERPADASTHWTAEDVVFGERETNFRALRGGKEWGRVTAPLAGAFNIRNMLAVIAAAESIGADRDGVREGLRTFTSVKRRMEVKGEANGVIVIDDFAHHPTAVRETIQAVRQRYPGRRVIALFEPRSFTAQRREFQDEFQSALATADEIVLGGLFHPERYTAETALDPGAMVVEWNRMGRPAAQFAEPDEIVRYVVPRVKSGDVVLVMSNGSFAGIHEKLLVALMG